MPTNKGELPVAELQKRLELARATSPLAAKRVVLVAASKTQPASRMIAAARLGVLHFGENKVQEAANKWPEVKEACPQARLHLIGALQTNKAKQAVALFDVIETLDRPELAEAIAKEAAKLQRCPELLIQVNTGEEPQKAGVLPKDMPSLLQYCMNLSLKVKGLMCIPPAHMPASPHFAFLRKLAIEHGLETLSMGMSEDFEQAIRLGATQVRLGRVLFGERDKG